MLACAADILEDASKNKVSVEEQFICFVKEEAKKAKAKKVKTTKPPEFKAIDLVSTPPPPSPTKIIQEYVLEETTVIPLDI